MGIFGHILAFWQKNNHRTQANIVKVNLTDDDYYNILKGILGYSLSCAGILFFFQKTHMLFRISKGAKIRNRYNQVPHLTQDTNQKVTQSQPDTTNESQEVSPFPAGDQKVLIFHRSLIFLAQTNFFLFYAYFDGISVTIAMI